VGLVAYLEKRTGVNRVLVEKPDRKRKIIYKTYT
jgi:hypothetical protein